ncbi:MAG: nitrous oxide-stimulated promoter family protein [Dehalococcoidales bacterium]|nr:MAG: nitrous oxide-stimulated promoter family protein [Dehalococcoidales bacterium]
MNDTRFGNLPSRLQREYNTVDAMISIYCKGHHGSQNTCDDCLELGGYALERLKKCPFREDKPTCAQCLVHCYKPVMRERIREVMKYSGPRMIYTHPIMAIQHLFDGKKKPA